MKKVLFIVLMMAGSSAFAQKDCSNEVIGGTAVLNSGGCGFSKPWACYDKIVTTCTDENGVITQFQQKEFVGCESSFADCGY